VLSNAFTPVGVDDIGRHLLDGNVPLIPAPREHRGIAVDPKLLDEYVGNYELAPGFVIAVTRDADHLFAQATGQRKFEIYPEGERDFFYKVVDAQITFVTDSSGKATELILHQKGQEPHGKRVP